MGNKMDKDVVRTQHAYHVQVEYMIKLYAQLKRTDKTNVINRTMYPLILEDFQRNGGLPFVITQYESETGRHFLPIGDLFPELKEPEEDAADEVMLEVEKMATE